MSHALRKTHDTGAALAVPTPREIALFLLEPSGESSVIIEEFDEEDDLTNVKYYSPTSD